MKQWSDVFPQARQVAEGVRESRRVRRLVYEGDPTDGTELDWAELALSVLSSLLTGAGAIDADDLDGLRTLEDWYYRNCAFLLDCGFHIEMPQRLGMCAEYPWGSN